VFKYNASEAASGCPLSGERTSRIGRPADSDRSLHLLGKTNPIPPARRRFAGPHPWPWSAGVLAGKGHLRAGKDRLEADIPGNHRRFRRRRDHRVQNLGLVGQHRLISGHEPEPPFASRKEPETTPQSRRSWIYSGSGRGFEQSFPARDPKPGLTPGSRDRTCDQITLDEVERIVI
jgi:hypothetical protein